MFIFTPSSLGYSGYQPRPRYLTQPSISPRDKYLAALAHARSAEADYVAALALEEAAERQRVEAAIFNRRYGDARRQFVLSDPTFDYATPDLYSRSNDFNPMISVYDPESRRRRDTLRIQEQERRVILRLQQVEQERVRQARQEELQRRICLAAILQQCQGVEQKRRCSLRRQKEVGLKRKEAERKDKEVIEELIGAFLGLFEPQAENDVQKDYSKPTSVPKREAAPAPEASASDRRTAKPSVTSAATKSTASGTTTQTGASSLKAELENRLGNEYENEVRDTIQAVLASLFHPQPTAAVPERTVASDALAADAKGKGKAVPVDAPPRAPTYTDMAKSLTQIKNAEASFQILESDFIFPHSPDFALPSSDNDSQIKLAYTSHNAPIHNYTHALSLILTQLDAVESFGNDDVRHRRKEVVDKVEGALEDIERVVQEKGNLSRKASRETLVKVEAAAEETEKKASAKEFVGSVAFTGLADTLGETAIQPQAEPAAVVVGSPTDATAPGESDIAAAVEGYVVADDDEVSESSASVVAAIDDSGRDSKVNVIPEYPAAPQEHQEETSKASAPVEPQRGDVEEEPSATEDADVTNLRTSVLANPLAKLEPPVTNGHGSAADSFLLTAAYSSQTAPKRPNVTDDDVADEGSDWSEVEA